MIISLINITITIQRELYLLSQLMFVNVILRSNYKIILTEKILIAMKNQRLKKLSKLFIVSINWHYRGKVLVCHICTNQFERISSKLERISSISSKRISSPMHFYAVSKNKTDRIATLGPANPNAIGCTNTFTKFIVVWLNSLWFLVN